MMRYFLFLYLLFAISCSNNNKHTSGVPLNSFTQFQKIESSHSGISFSNTIKENLSTKENLFDNDFFYNGAGVAIGDINNDGLPDIFFTGNQVANKLYLNKGDLKFEDISATAKINTHKNWSNGVTLADVNEDGWLDIYISQGGPHTADKRANLLFINQKDLSFKESAAAYGLADKGISTQSAFFDYDKDGDLDCVVMNENALFGFDPISFFQRIETKPTLKHNSSSHFYRNDNGKFQDITKEAGLLNASFGLGLVVSDINEDGWLDIYIANDYYIPDAMYINNKNGKFTDQIKSKTKQISFYGMGADIEDINNDGLQDIFVLDMASSDHYRAKTLMASMNVENFDLLVNTFQFPYQYMYNSFQINLGNGVFNNHAHLTKMAKTDWSWTVLMMDFDNDEHKDIFITNGYRRYALDNDTQNKVRAAKIKYKGDVPLAVKKQLYDGMPTEKLPNLLFHNKTNLKFEEAAKNWGLAEPSYSNGTACADLDLDGDLDLVVSNIDQTAFLFQNQTSDNKAANYLRVKTRGTLSESFAKVLLKYNGRTQYVESKRVKGYRSSSENIAHFGLGKMEKIDSVIVKWLNGKEEIRTNVKANQTIEFNENEASNIADYTAPQYQNKYLKASSVGDLKLFYKHKENIYNDFAKEILLPYKQSTQGPIISKGDINNDGLDDIFITGSAGQKSQLFIQENGLFKKLKSPALEADNLYEDMEALFFDYDNDGDNDLLVLSGGNEFKAHTEIYENRLYQNDGKGNLKRINNAFTNFKNSKTLATIDYDKDGDLDLIIGNRIIPQNYPRPESSVIYKNENGKFVEQTALAEGLNTFGIINKILVTDFNNDGWDDFIAVGEWTGIGLFQNEKGRFKNISRQSDLDNEKGWWFSIGETDINKDGKKDYLIGNLGLNSKYKATKDKALRIYANDFDENGSADIVLSSKYKGDYVPFRGRECSSQQMPFIKEKFPTYDQFAKASIEDVYGEKLKDAYVAEANTFASILLINKGNGHFEKQILPIEAQAFPILDVVFFDVNKDGYEDAIIAGSIYNTEVETPRLDNDYGLVLISNQQSGYRVIKPLESGLYISGNVKSLEIIKVANKNKSYLLAAKNNDILSLFQFENSK